MPELPDITVYIEALTSRILHERLITVRVLNPFVLRTFEPPISAANGRDVIALRRIGKRIVIGLDGELFVVIHLMIAGRLRWFPLRAMPDRWEATGRSGTFAPAQKRLAEIGR